MSELPEPLTSCTTTGSLAQAWEAFWFTPTDSQPLAAVRFAAGIIGMLACGTYAADLTEWFGPAGLLPAETVAAWRSPLALSLFDACGSVASLWAAFVLLAVLFGLLAIGLLTPVVTPLAAIGWSAVCTDTSPPGAGGHRCARVWGPTNQTGECCNVRPRGAEFPRW